MGYWIGLTTHSRHKNVRSLIWFSAHRLSHTLRLPIGYLGEHFTKHGCVVARHAGMKNWWLYVIHKYKIYVCLLTINKLLVLYAAMQCRL